MDAISTAVAAFERDGYYIARSLFSTEEVSALVELIDRSLSPALAPVEFEADVHYPGAPSSKSAPGGSTPRRLLHAFGRDSLFQQVGRHPQIVATLKALMNTDAVRLSQNHHNCVMTKHPGFSSVTSWHQDIRYWRFDRRELVSTWLALGPENAHNGGLLVIPGSHTLDFEPGQFDAALFLRTDLPANEALLAKVVSVDLKAGDMLFFHSRTLHAAGQNDSSVIKRSLVYTYRADDNQPIPETRSAVYEDIPVS
ncbi:phytanoyl-CoA dioxygenase family protein [Granulosicoccus antarcticus]|uniref:Ectoine dioxygenase n=1 Tax=Granulosicoccus antarcticus IMCC3135 TaxID=1192854 RepID=A0A2Z2NMJ6_9GAMM|nr:phytanoyl-CoA dioxygenase family protein [Granulosicoccus antarcticus]ASJ71745.1 Ectoine dioxygenase [Granulosicoccus antarcticus IMCC3135]